MHYKIHCEKQDLWDPKLESSEKVLANKIETE